MVHFRYVGDHHDLQGETAWGRYNSDGKFVVQCDGHKQMGLSVPYLDVDGQDWSHGWHETPRDDWEFTHEPKFVGTRDECDQLVLANRFTLDFN
jgi:hypothetical protein